MRRALLMTDFAIPFAFSAAPLPAPLALTLTPSALGLPAQDKNVKDPGPIEGHAYTFNSTELRLISNSSAAAGAAIQLEMRALPPVGGVPLRVCSRLVNQPRVNYRNVAYQVTETKASMPEQLWEITSGSERVILDNCW